MRRARECEVHQREWDLKRRMLNLSRKEENERRKLRELSIWCGF